MTKIYEELIVYGFPMKEYTYIDIISYTDIYLLIDIDI